MLIAIQVDVSAPVPGVEAYMPEVKYGNLKDPAKREAKALEASEKFQEAIPSDGFLSLAAGFRVLTDYDPLVKVDSKDTLLAALDVLGALPAPATIVGIHPTTHLSMIRNRIIRDGLDLPAVFGYRSEVVNPWRLMTMGSVVECDTDQRQAHYAAEIGLSKDLLEASLELAKRLQI